MEHSRYHLGLFWMLTQCSDQINIISFFFLQYTDIQKTRPSDSQPTEQSRLQVLNYNIQEQSVSLNSFIEQFYRLIHLFLFHIIQLLLH